MLDVVHDEQVDRALRGLQLEAELFLDRRKDTRGQVLGKLCGGRALLRPPLKIEHEGAAQPRLIYHATFDTRRQQVRELLEWHRSRSESECGHRLPAARQIAVHCRWRAAPSAIDPRGAVR